MIYVVSADPNLYVNQSFALNIVGAKVTVNVTNLREGVEYFFSVYASNVYGTSDPVTVRSKFELFIHVHTCTAHTSSKYTHKKNTSTHGGSFLNDNHAVYQVLLLLHCL